MKKNLITLAFLFIFALTSSVAIAGERSRYGSSTGNNYKYDLSDPDDRLDYKLDKDSQMDDRINPDVKMDRQLRQYGGGIQD